MDRGWKDREERKSEGLGVNLKFVGILEKNLWAKMYGDLKKKAIFRVKDF